MSRIRDWLKRNKQKSAAWPRNMAVLYLLFIIVPLFVTDTIVSVMLRNYNRSDRTYSYEKAAENMEYLFGTVLDNASSIVMNVLRNDEIDDFLEKDYDSNIDYYQNYRQVTNNKFLRALCSVNNASLEIYTDNPTIINGGGIYSIDRAGGSGWYYSDAYRTIMNIALDHVSFFKRREHHPAFLLVWVCDTCFSVISY